MNTELKLITTPVLTRPVWLKREWLSDQEAWITANLFLLIDWYHATAVWSPEQSADPVRHFGRFCRAIHDSEVAQMERFRDEFRSHRTREVE